MNVVVVESPAKAKTINKYLGPDFTVLASYGHVRDLPPKDGSVRPDEDFAMDWTVDGKADKTLKDIARAVKGARRLYLATDPDREGEAISWHVREELARRRALAGVDVLRVTFNAITKSAVKEAIDKPRDLDADLIDAYLARRALDYLVGFTLSPVLWRKLPGSRSAGRVQSVALRLICEREAEIERFVSQEYWSVSTRLAGEGGAEFAARLSHLRGDKLGKFDLPDEAAATDAVRAVNGAVPLSVRTVERKKAKRNPAPPFTTSTLQQEAARKLQFSASKTMSTAQRLYEGVSVGGETVGLITYMRTDGVQMAPEAINDLRTLIARDIGQRFLPDSPRMWKTKAKNAQEAHEAIRPTNPFLTPKEVRSALDHDQFRLYELIWKRALASQMESALLDQVAAEIGDTAGTVVLRATGQSVVFPGFLEVYRESLDDQSEDEDGDKVLPPLKEGQPIDLRAVTPDQHFTQPPPRYGEASLVKRLEELGIGRPSTYAAILQVLQDRSYVRLESRRFVPEDRGRVVTAFLESFFRRYVEYTFTADLENQLDDVSGGRADWRAVLRAFWKDFMAAVDGTKDLRVSQVLEALDQDLGPHLFPVPADGGDPRACPACTDGRLALKLGKFGAFIGCSNYPDCRYTRPLGGGEEAEKAALEDNRVLGEDPDTGLPVIVKKGPYGWYVQLGEADPEDKKKKPKRASLPRGTDPGGLDLERGLKLLALPREIGPYPDTGEMIVAGIGRFGPYLRHGDQYVSLKGDDDVLEVGWNRAVEIVASAKPRKPRTPARTLGDHPADGKPVTLQDGRWGPYVEHAKLRANLPKGTEPDQVTLERAVELLDAKAERSGKKPPGKAAAAKKKGAAKGEAAAAEGAAEKTAAGEKGGGTKKATTASGKGKAGDKAGAKTGGKTGAEKAAGSSSGSAKTNRRKAESA